MLKALDMPSVFGRSEAGCHDDEFEEQNKRF
jgi:hypothetical protein